MPELLTASPNRMIPARAIEPALQWFAVHTHSHCESRVSSYLEAKGMANYLPAREEVHQWKDRKRKVSVPLFPGYLFIQMPEGAPWLPVLQVPGVVQIVGHGTQPQAISDAEIESVRLAVSSRAGCWTYPYLTEGSWVLVKRGPLKGLEGYLVRVKNQARVVITVHALAQAVAVEVDARDVERAGRKAQVSRCTPI